MYTKTTRTLLDKQTAIQEVLKTRPYSVSPISDRKGNIYLSVRLDEELIKVIYDLAVDKAEKLCRNASTGGFQDLNRKILNLLRGMIGEYSTIAILTTYAGFRPGDIQPFDLTRDTLDYIKSEYDLLLPNGETVEVRTTEGHSEKRYKETYFKRVWWFKYLNEFKREESTDNYFFQYFFDNIKGELTPQTLSEFISSYLKGETRIVFAGGISAKNIEGVEFKLDKYGRIIPGVEYRTPALEFVQDIWYNTCNG